jgi:low temperature requirement protein LtrA
MCKHLWERRLWEESGLAAGQIPLEPRLLTRVLQPCESRPGVRPGSGYSGCQEGKTKSGTGRSQPSHGEPCYIRSRSQAAAPHRYMDPPRLSRTETVAWLKMHNSRWHCKQGANSTRGSVGRAGSIVAPGCRAGSVERGILRAVNHPRGSAGARRRPWIAPLEARSPEEEHRVATPLELFFDLVIVVAVARAASGLHHALSEGHVESGLIAYAMVFFGVWWAWVNFTWFASAYDNDDVVYRLLVFVQLTGALVFAAGIPRFEDGDLTIGTLGYVIMRLALVVQWLRAARSDPPRRSCAHRYAIGVFVVQTAWVGLLFVPSGLRMTGFLVLAVSEMLVPVWAERGAPTTWHPHHIAERYGLFTIIALGESVLAASNAVASASATNAVAGALALSPIIVGGLLIVFGCWWLYFDHPGHELLTSLPAAFVWGYGHYFVFASAAAIGAGLAVAVDSATRHAHISGPAAGAAVAVPVAAYLLSLWFLHARAERSFASRVVTPLAVIGILFAPFTSQAVLCTGSLMAALVGFKIARAAP